MNRSYSPKFAYKYNQKSYNGLASYATETEVVDEYGPCPLHPNVRINKRKYVRCYKDFLREEVNK